MDSTSEQIREADIEDYDLDERAITDAANRLAEAFSIIEEYQNFLPASVYNTLVGEMQSLYDLSQWQADPDLMRKILPHIIRAAIRNLKTD